MSIDRICIVTNRNITKKWFGERGNAKGIGEVRIATAWKNVNGKFSVSILEERKGDEVLPSEKLFREYVEEIQKSKMNAVLYVHGFNTSFEKSLREAWDIHKTYGTGVVLFSWPSKPGGMVLEEYKKARMYAGASSLAFDNTLEKLKSYIRRAIEEATKKGIICDSTFNLMCFSQGNYLLQKFIQSEHFESETRLFSNVVLMQADVDSHGHEVWASANGRVRTFRRLYVTINENDWVLRKSEKVNSDRLGCTVDNLHGKGVRYIDFTDATKIGKAHGFFKSNKKGNGKGSQVRLFFKSVLHGRMPEREIKLQHDSNLGVWQVK